MVGGGVARAAIQVGDPAPGALQQDVPLQPLLAQRAFGRGKLGAQVIERLDQVGRRDLGQSLTGRYPVALRYLQQCRGSRLGAGQVHLHGKDHLAAGLGGL